MIIFFLFFLSFFSFHASFLQRHRSAERRTRREIIRISTVCSLSTFLNSILIEFVVSLASTVMFPRTRNSVLPISTNEKLFKQQFSCSHNYHSNEYVIFVLEKKREKKKKRESVKSYRRASLPWIAKTKKSRKLTEITERLYVPCSSMFPEWSRISLLCLRARLNAILSRMYIKFDLHLNNYSLKRPPCTTRLSGKGDRMGDL